MTAPLVYVVDDDPLIRRLLEHALGALWECRTVLLTDGGSCLERCADTVPDLVILDILMEGMSGMETLSRLRETWPALPVIILSSQSRIDVAIETMKRGAHDYFTKPVDLQRLEFSVRNALKMSALQGQVESLRESLARSVRFDSIVTTSGAMEDALRLVDKARNSDITVLIEGESGTGKEMIARAIHFNGRRAQGPFVVVNCAAIPKDLLESELFGHEKGAFTGADTRKIGRFEMADGGTLFLDEIGELDLSLQAKMLRAIQQKQFERVGGGETLTTDARIVSATNRDLKEMCSRGAFREDLYYRLASFPIPLPPLRERPEDVALLADHFLREAARRENRMGLSYSPEALRRMLAYPWPGNVRELQSAVDRAVLLADGPVVRERDLPAAIAAAPLDAPRRATDTASPATPEAAGIIPLEVLKERAVRHALQATGGVQADAARRLGIGRTTLHELIRKYGLDPRAYQKS